jgi:tetratricopeptide (TPR) repeat protein
MKHIFVVVLLVTAQIAGAQDIYNKGKAQLAARDTAGAFSSFLDAVKAGQKQAESNYYLGAISFARHNVDDAIGYLLASYKSDDDVVEVARLLGDAYLEKKDIKGALMYYRVATKLAPKDCGITVALGQALVVADSMDPAIIQLMRAKECMPENPTIYLSLGDAYFKIGVKPLAIINYQKASELAPNNRDIQLKVARALASNKQYNEAIDAYIRAEKIDSTYQDPYLEHGRILVLAKFYRQAISPLGRFVKLSPMHLEGSVLYTKALFGYDLFPEAANAAKTSLQLDSNNVDIWRIRAFSLVDAKDAKDRDYKGALEAFAAIQRRNAIKPEDHIMMGRAYFGAGMDTEAFESFQKAIATDSANCDIYFPFGSLFMKKQDYASASQLFEKKIVCDPRSLSAYINAAIAYMQPSNLNLSRARELLLKSIELRGDFLQGRLWLARYYVQVDSFDLAEAQYLEVLQLIGDQVDKNKVAFGEAQKLLGSLYMTKQKYRLAIDAFTKSRSVGADDANVHLSWGQAVLQTLDPSPAGTEAEAENAKKNQDALEHFATCVKKDPGNCQGHFWLGECYVRSRVPGDDERNAELKRKACEEWRTVLKLCPKNEDAKKGLDRISCG